jgi:hypothetical protein
MLVQVYNHLHASVKPTSSANMDLLHQLVLSVGSHLTNFDAPAGALHDVKESAQESCEVARRYTLTFKYSASQWEGLSSGPSRRVGEAGQDFYDLLEIQDRLKGSIGTLASRLQKLVELAHTGAVGKDTTSSPVQRGQNPADIRSRRKR